MNHLFIDNLTVIDFAYLDPDRGLVGESWISDIVLGGELDEQGMVFDFSNVKRTIKRLIDEQVDHRLVVPAHSECLKRGKTGAHLSWTLTNGTQIHHKGPEQSVVYLDHNEVTRPAVARLLEQELKAVLPANVTDVQVSLREEQIEGAYYHYVHGLKKHLGNCQRIAHGHRSQIHIHINGQRDTNLERHWAEQWRDIYIATRDDLSESWSDADGTEYVRFQYDAEQGEFTLTLPRQRVWFLETDTTVELIAAYLADEIKASRPGDEVRVRAFEGVGKGAIAVR